MSSGKEQKQTRVGASFQYVFWNQWTSHTWIFTESQGCCPSVFFLWKHSQHSICSLVLTASDDSLELPDSTVSKEKRLWMHLDFIIRYECIDSRTAILPKFQRSKMASAWEVHERALPFVDLYTVSCHISWSAFLYFLLPYLKLGPWLTYFIGLPFILFFPEKESNTMIFESLPQKQYLLLLVLRK